MSMLRRAEEKPVGCDGAAIVLRTGEGCVVVSQCVQCPVLVVCVLQLGTVKPCILTSLVSLLAGELALALVVSCVCPFSSESGHWLCLRFASHDLFVWH